MEYFLTKHAKQRLRERAISKKFFEQSLLRPTQKLYDPTGRLLIKKLYTKRGQQRVLLIAAIPHNQELRIITIIDTSKVKKYL